MRRKIISILIAMALSLSMSVCVFAATNVSFIVDEFDFLTTEELAELNNLAAEIYEDRGVGVFFVFTYEESLADYDVDQLVGGITDYVVMIENVDSWYTFMGGKGKAIDNSTEEYLRGIYDYAETYEGGIRDFLNATAQCFPVIDASEDKSPTESTVPLEEEPLVLDIADLLSNTEEAQLDTKLSSLSRKYQAQITIVTIASMDGGDIDEFTEYFYNNMGFGYGEKHDGVLLLVCMDPREYRIHSHGFASEAVTMDVIDAIGEEIVQDLSDGNYAAAFDIFVDRCEYYIDGHLNGFPFDFAGNLAIALIIGIVAGLIVAFVLKGQLKSVRKQNQANTYVKSDSVNITVQSELFLYRDIKRTEKESSSSSRSGSSGNTGGGSF